MKAFKPLLSATYSTSNTTLNFPYLASRKLDGIRCIIINGKPVSRSLKPIPNKFVQFVLSNSEFNNLDGELICGAANDPACFRNTTQIVMSHDRRQEFIFHVFDDISSPDEPFEIRLATAKSRIESLNHPNIKLVEHQFINHLEEFESLERSFVSDGYEGMMIRSLTGRYKFGRSTANEDILTKVKRFSDSEAIVIGFEELQQNNNEAVKDALGYQKRASCQENKKGLSSLGAILCRDMKSGIEFHCGTGLTAEERQIVWDDRQGYLGLTLKYKFFTVGVKEKPRHPVFLGWRGDE